MKPRALLLIVLTALSIPVILMVRALRPLVRIRFGQLQSPRIGHFVGNTEVYLCKRDAGMYGRRTFDIFYHCLPICNQQLKKMWDRTLHVSRIAILLARANRWLPGYKDHVVPLSLARDIDGLFEHTKPHLTFTSEEERKGREMLGKLGVPDSGPFICFYARDSAYLNSIISSNNWDYHNYRDSSIHNFILAAEKLTDRGCYLIRMGAIVKEPLETVNPKIIDYARKGRNDFLDIFLCAKCRFFIGDSAGIYSVPMIFRRPRAEVNSIPLEYVHAWGSKDLFIPKKLRLRKEKRFMTFREILDSGTGRFLRTEQYERLGIEIIENTPQEIAALAVEMDERLKGSWQTTREDEELQRRFWSFFKPSELNRVFRSRIGTEFLRQNKELLE